MKATDYRDNKICFDKYAHLIPLDHILTKKNSKTFVYLNSCNHHSLAENQFDNNAVPVCMNVNYELNIQKSKSNQITILWNMEKIQYHTYDMVGIQFRCEFGI
jgi:hypothetical protein